MFRKLFRVSCDFVKVNGAKGKVTFEAKYFFDLRKDKFTKMLEREIINCLLTEHRIVAKEIKNLDIKRIG